MTINRILIAGFTLKQIYFVYQSEIVIFTIRNHMATTPKVRQARDIAIRITMYRCGGMGIRIIAHHFRGIAPLHVVEGLIQDGHPVLFAVTGIGCRGWYAGTFNLTHLIGFHSDLTEFHASLTVGSGVTAYATEIHLVVPAEQASIF